MKKNNILLVFMMVVAGAFGYGRLLRPSIDTIVSYVAYPYVCVRQRCANIVAALTYKYTTIAQLQALVRELQDERDTAFARAVEAQGKLDAVSDAQDMLSFAQRYEVPVVGYAQIIGRSMGDSHSILIDAGSGAGVTLDMVVAYKNCILGRISAVYPWYSRVTLITDRLSKIGAYCAGTNAYGICEGLNESSQLRLSFIPLAQSVREGQYVFTSGEGTIFPRGFLLGIVDEVRPGDLYHDILLSPARDVNDITYCSVIHK